MEISPQLMQARAVSLPIRGKGFAFGAAKSTAPSALAHNDQLKVSGHSPSGLPAVNGIFNPSPLKNALRGLAGTVNAPILNYLRSFYHSPLHQPLLKALEAELSPSQGVQLKSLENKALKASREVLPHAQPAERVLLAYQALSALAATHPLSDPQFYQGQSDKPLHYFSSAMLTVAAVQKLPPLPGQTKVAGLLSDGVGICKEIIGPPYNPEDLQANREGIASAKLALRHEIQQSWWLDRTGFAP